jgi:hypothetical protein
MGDRRAHTEFRWGDSREIDHLEDQAVGGGDDIKMCLKEVGWGDMDWIYLAQDRDRWRELVTGIINLRVP